MVFNEMEVGVCRHKDCQRSNLPYTLAPGSFYFMLGPDEGSYKQSGLLAAALMKVICGSSSGKCEAASPNLITKVPLQQL